MEIRIWKKSELIGKTVKEITLECGVEVIKVLRGGNASTHEGLIIAEGDYMTYVGEALDCLKVLRKR